MFSGYMVGNACFFLRGKSVLHTKYESMEKVFEEICAIFTSVHPRERKAMELGVLYSSLGRDSVAVDNMLYERMGLCCEDLIDMLLRGKEKISC